MYPCTERARDESVSRRNIIESETQRRQTQKKRKIIASRFSRVSSPRSTREGNEQVKDEKLYGKKGVPCVCVCVCIYVCRCVSSMYVYIYIYIRMSPSKRAEEAKNKGAHAHARTHKQKTVAHRREQEPHTRKGKG